MEEIFKLNVKVFMKRYTRQEASVECNQKYNMEL